MIRISARQWAMALSAALLVHAAVAAVIVVWQPPKSGAKAAGMGGIAVSLGPVGGAPGGEARPIEAVAEAETVEPTEIVRTESPPEEAAVVPLSTVSPERVPPVETEAAKPRDIPVEAVLVEEVAPVVPADTAPVENTREVAARRPIDEMSLVPLKPDTPQPIEPVEMRTVELAETPAGVAGVEEAPAVEVMEMMAVERQPSIQAKRAEQPVRRTEVRPPDEIGARAMFAPLPPKPKPEPPESSRRDAKPETAPEAVRGPAQRVAQPSESPEDRTAAAASSLSGVGGKSGTLLSPNAGSGDNTPGGGTPGAVADYYGRLQAWLEKHKRYPRRAKLRNEQGVALLRFVVTRAGEVTDFSIEESSGYSLLDEEVREMLRRAQPLPKMPSEMHERRVELLVPVQFFLR